MNKLIVFLVVAIFLSGITTSAQTPLWQGKGRIAISSDGNDHDHDDWAATPLTLALLASQSLQEKVVLYTYSDHIWSSNLANKTSPDGKNGYDNMRESALGGQKWFGFDKTNFICAVDNPEIAYNTMRDAINQSGKQNPLIIVAAGPMHVVGEAINRSDIKKRKFVTVLSHSTWNNKHADSPGKAEPTHSGWTFKEMQDTFGIKEGGDVKFVQITDQNGGGDYDGFNAPIAKFDWIKTSEARNNPAYKAGSWDWLYSRQETCYKENGANFDPSDAGMIVFMLTGVEKTEPNMGQKLMENPVAKKQ